MRIVVTGFRNWKTRRRIWDELAHWDWISGRRLEVAVGDCETGVDEYTRQWVRHAGRQDLCKVYCAGVSESPDLPASYVSSWVTNGKAAGPIRNKAMIDTWQPLVVLAFLHPDSKGAVGCAEYARLQGIQVIDFWEPRGD
jgi:hypothetical protein